MSPDEELVFFEARRLDRTRFGDASRCKTTDEALEVLRADVDPATASRAAALAMVLAIDDRSGATTYEELRAAQRALAAAKARIDQAARHAPVVVATTERIARAADAFIEATTVPVTEWPTVRALVGRVVHAAEVAERMQPAEPASSPMSCPGKVEARLQKGAKDLDDA